MIWNAPAWSPTIHPRIPQEAGRYQAWRLPARKRQCLPRPAIWHSGGWPFATCLPWRASAGSSLRGWVCFRQLNLRHGTLSYTSGFYFPHRGMLEHGVSFATFEKLETDTLEDLSQRLPSPWSGKLEMQSKEKQISDDDQQELTSSTMVRVGQQPGRSRSRAS